MRKTKIVCTIGPVTCELHQLERLAKGGMNVARLNMSHGDHKWHGAAIDKIKKLNKKGHSIAIMLDTKGPEIRSGDLKQEVHLKSGDQFTFTIRKEVDYGKNCVEVSYDGFIDDVSVGDTILVDGGMLSFKVIEITKKDVICRSLDDGVLTSRRHLNIRGKSAHLPSITQKDWEDIDFAIKERVDFIALSFVKKSSAIHKLKNYLTKKNSFIKVIAKIESAASIPHIDDILEVTDGAMVARGDLGAELPVEEVPLLQDMIVRKCRELGKPVIVATHLLESMISHPTPTRAEVADIAEAVKEKTDAIMLSGETAAGNYPFKALEVMDTVARRIEKHLSQDKTIRARVSNNPKQQIVLSAAILANNSEANAILVFTRSGFMASLLSRTRPNSPLYAFASTAHVCRKLHLYWGLRSFRIDFSPNPEDSIQKAIGVLKKQKRLKKGSTIVIVSDILAGKELVDTVQVRKI
ncbi:pyruvate kinase [Candidatus Peregrinibacteria bacterium CG_4_10_14_0_2_um_filter_43_11]|nr:MAG: pyruvate kinase [Candidatus Peregrinibacteria bacterium CG_4_10_14_0_2_um_filter_43_11]